MSSRHVVRVLVAGALAAGIVAFLVSCQTRSERSTTADSTGAAGSAQAAAMERGHLDYLAYCAMCHGEWGGGDGPLSGQLRAHGGIVPAKLNDRERLNKIGRAEVARVIEKGGAHTGRSNLMPPWAERMSSQSIQDVADFVMTLPDLDRTPPLAVARYLEAPAGSAPEGRVLFVNYCVLCHGPNGKGNGVYADTLEARNHIRPRDLTDSTYLAKRTDQELYVVIAMGGAHSGKSEFMPMWDVTLPPDQIKDLVSYVRAISKTPSRP